MDVTKIALPSRSRYQLENFVIKQHDTPEMQFRQVILEIQQLAKNIEISKIDKELAELKRDSFLNKDTPKARLKAKKIDIEINSLNLAIIGAEYEISVLNEIKENIPNFTAEEIESDQNNYWQKRLTRQAELDILQVTSGIGVGNSMSLLQAGLVKLKNGNLVDSIESKKEELE
jgi:hypothetical protein